MGAGFSTSSPDLAGTRFRVNDLIVARSVYADVFADLDPQWPSDPIGPLASHWLADGSYSATYLIHVARVLWQLSNGNITTKSFPILRDKVLMLLRPPTLAAYEETLIELEVAASLSERASPISFEPLVPDDLSDAPSKPRSPDYGLRLPESDGTVEVTVWHWKMMRDWDLMATELRNRLEVKLAKLGLHRHVAIELPIRLSNVDARNLTSSAVLQALSSPTGELVRSTVVGDTRMQWFEIPHFQSVSQLDFTRLSSGMDTVTIGGVVESAFGCSWDWVLPMFSRRIWPNSKYKWLSALCAFSPQRNWQLGAPPPKLVFDWNPGAEIPVPNSLRMMAQVGESYHM